MQLDNGTAVVDNFLSLDMVEFLDDYYSHELPHYYGHRSNKESLPFYYCQIQPDPLHKLIWNKITKVISSDLILSTSFSFNVGRPNWIPFSFAVASPALTRSCIIERSNSAKTDTIPNIALPVGVFVSIPCE